MVGIIGSSFSKQTKEIGCFFCIVKMPATHSVWITASVMVNSSTDLAVGGVCGRFQRTGEKKMLVDKERIEMRKVQSVSQVNLSNSTSLRQLVSYDKEKRLKNDNKIKLRAFTHSTGTRPWQALHNIFLLLKRSLQFSQKQGSHNVIILKLKRLHELYVTIESGFVVLLQKEQLLDLHTRDNSLLGAKRQIHVYSHSH